MIRLLLTSVALLVISACVPPPPGPTPGTQLPPVPPADGALRIEVVYPAEGATLTAADSNFIFGNVGTGRATLRINGTPVEVAPNGAFLGFVPVPPDGVYELTASAEGQTLTDTRRVKLPATADGPPEPGRLWIDPGSIGPRGAFTGIYGERYDVRFRGTPGAEARLRLPNGSIVPLAERQAVERAEGFMLERQQKAAGVSEYAGTFALQFPLLSADSTVGRSVLATDDGHTRPLERAGGVGGATIELIRGADTLAVPLAANVDLLPDGVTRVGVAASERADRTVIGRAVPGPGSPYHWFFPNGTLLEITGDREGMYRVQLTNELSVWVDPSEVRLLPPGTPPPRGSVNTVRAIPAEGYVDLRLSTSERLPFRIDGSDRGLTITVYGARSRTNWLQYGRQDPLIDGMEWEQVADDLYRLHVHLAEPLWGWLPFWDEEGNLIVRLRRPPALDPDQPLRGLLIGVDAGHPPGGAIGPTRLTEAEANLAIAKWLVPLLEAQGARVLEIRPDTAAVGLGQRPLLAARLGGARPPFHPQQRIPRWGQPVGEQWHQCLL